MLKPGAASGPDILFPIHNIPVRGTGPAAKTLLSWPRSRPPITAFRSLEIQGFARDRLARMVMAETDFAASRALEARPELCRRFHVWRLDLFGSATTGRFDRARSDLDILVAFETLPTADYAAAYFGLHAALETLAGRKVDLMTEAALENPHLRQRVEAERQVLFQAP